MRPLVILKRYLAILAACSADRHWLRAVLSRPIVRPLIGLANVARDVKEGKYEGIKQLKNQNRSVF